MRPEIAGVAPEASSTTPPRNVMIAKACGTTSGTMRPKTPPTRWTAVRRRSNS